MVSRRVISSVMDALAVASQILESATEEVVWVAPLSLLSLSERHGLVEQTRAFIRRGGVSRGVVPLSRASVRELQASPAIGADVRHSDEAHELLMFVGDRRQSISAINVGIDDFTRDTPLIAFWSEDPTYAQYLLASFEYAWSRAIPAERLRSR